MKNSLTILVLAMSTISFAQNKLHFGVQANGNLTIHNPFESAVK